MKSVTAGRELVLFGAAAPAAGAPAAVVPAALLLLAALSMPALPPTVALPAVAALPPLAGCALPLPAAADLAGVVVLLAFEPAFPELLLGAAARPDVVGAVAGGCAALGAPAVTVFAVGLLCVASALGFWQLLARSPVNVVASASVRAAVLMPSVAITLLPSSRLQKTERAITVAYN